MNKSVVFYAIGSILLVLAVALVVPLGVSLGDPEPARSNQVTAFAITIGVTAAFGLLLRRLCRKHGQDLGHREGFAVVSLGWLFMTLFGAMPFLLSGALTSFPDAFFETMSGFSTTGATILEDIEALPNGMLFWRSLTHWLGGMGIVLLSVAILPALGAGGSQLFNAEVPGITGERLTPRIAETAKMLWKVYILFTVLMIFFLMLGGMNLFDSICHTFSTMATGGFSTKNASIGHYNSAYIEWVVIAFMFIASVNFVLHFHALSGRFRPLRENSELRIFVILLIGSMLVLGGFLYLSPDAAFHGEQPPPESETIAKALRGAAFQATAIITTTGFGTADFDHWPDICRVALLLLMFCGACNGSTCGSMKLGRVIILSKYGYREIQRLIRPRAVYQVRLGKKSVDPSIVDNVIGFCLLFGIIFMAGSLGVMVLEELFGSADIDILTAFSAAASTLTNVGPGLGGVGPSETYAWFCGGTKMLLSFMMILGRLELYCILVLLTPSIWRR